MTGRPSGIRMLIGVIVAALCAVAGALPLQANGAAQRRTVTAALDVPAPHQVQSRRGPLGHSRTLLASLAAAPFPYDGVVPPTNRPFVEPLDPDGRRGRRTGRGHILWEDEAYADRRVLLHIPRGFDARRPGHIVVFFHGHGATVDADVAQRQQVPQQIARSGANAVLVAPQLAVNSADSSIGKLWQPGAFARFLDEAAGKLGTLYGDPRAARSFAAMPVVIVAYSGGYVAAAWSAHHGGIGRRLRGIVLLDGLYGEIDKLADWIERDPSVFFVSAYTESTRRRNEQMRQLLAARSRPVATELGSRVRPGTLAFIPTGETITHRDFVSEAWAPEPIRDLLARLDNRRRY